MDFLGYMNFTCTLKSMEFSYFTEFKGKEESSSDDDPDPADEWVKTSYIYDITMPYYEVLTEETDGVTKAYDYGIERISAITSDFWYTSRRLTCTMAEAAWRRRSPTTYRGTPYKRRSHQFSTSARVTRLLVKCWDTRRRAMATTASINDAATGMVNLRTRQYEPAMMRFGQKDIRRGNVWISISLNRYPFAANNSVMFEDPSGEFILTAILIGAVSRSTYWWNGGRCFKL